MAEFILDPDRVLTLEEVTELLRAMIGNVPTATLPSLQEALPLTGEYLVEVPNE